MKKADRLFGMSCRDYYTINVQKRALKDEMIWVFLKMNPKRQELLIQVSRTLLLD